MAPCIRVDFQLLKEISACCSHKPETIGPKMILISALITAYDEYINST